MIPSGKILFSYFPMISFLMFILFVVLYGRGIYSIQEGTVDRESGGPNPGRCGQDSQAYMVRAPFLISSSQTP